MRHGNRKFKGFKLAVFQNAEKYDSVPTIAVQLATLAVFLIGCFIASRGLNPLKKLMSIAGTSMFVMSLLYIVMMFAAPAINPNAGFVSMDFSIKNLIPNFNVGYFTSLSILVFAVGGCEKISPYVNKVENPSKGFPKGIIAMAIMVLVCAMLGTVAMGMMFDPTVVNESPESFNSYAANGFYWAFVAYMALRKHYDSIDADYRFVKNQGVAYFFGAWCFLVTAASCILGMYNDDKFTMALNIITPLVLTALGLILPMIAKRENKQREDFFTQF